MIQCCWEKLFEIFSMVHQDNNTKVYKVYTPTHYKSILRDEMENNIIISLHVFLLFIYLIWSLSSCATLICKIIDVQCNLPPGGTGTTMSHFVAYFQPWTLPRTHQIRSLLCSKIWKLWKSPITAELPVQFYFSPNNWKDEVSCSTPIPFDVIWFIHFFWVP